MAKTLCGFDDGPLGTGQRLLVQFGPTLRVDIGFDVHFTPTSGRPPNLAVKGVTALIDTGATASCIDSGLAMQLNLPIIDRQRVSGVHGVREVNMHLGHVVIPTLGKYISGAFAGVDLIAGGQPHHALIGRMFLQHFVLFYDGRTGLVSISDELPLT
jgi:predicted aspartyl protease